MLHFFVDIHTAIGTTDKIVLLTDSLSNLLNKLECFTDEIIRIRFSLDSKIMAVLTSSGKIHIFTVDFYSMEINQRNTFYGHLKTYHSIELSNDGSYIILTDNHKSIEIMDAITGKELNRLIGNFINYSAPIVKFLPSKTNMIVYVEYENGIDFVEYPFVKIRKRLGVHVGGSKYVSVHDISYSDDGSIIAILSKCHLDVWDITTYSLINRFNIFGMQIEFTGAYRSRVPLSSDGKFVALECDENILGIFDLKSGTLLGKLKHVYTLHAYAFGKNIIVTAAGGGDIYNPDFVGIHIWDRDTYHLLTVIRVSSLVRSIVFNKMYNIFYVNLFNGRIQVFSSINFELLAEF